MRRYTPWAIWIVVGAWCVVDWIAHRDPSDQNVARVASGQARRDAMCDLGTMPCRSVAKFCHEFRNELDVAVTVARVVKHCGCLDVSKLQGTVVEPRHTLDICGEIAVPSEPREIRTSVELVYSSAGDSQERLWTCRVRCAAEEVFDVTPASILVEARPGDVVKRSLKWRGSKGQSLRVDVGALPEWIRVSGAEDGGGDEVSIVAACDETSQRGAISLVPKGGEGAYRIDIPVLVLVEQAFVIEPASLLICGTERSKAVTIRRTDGQAVGVSDVETSVPSELELFSENVDGALKVQVAMRDASASSLGDRSNLFHLRIRCRAQGERRIPILVARRNLDGG